MPKRKVNDSQRYSLSSCTLAIWEREKLHKGGNELQFLRRIGYGVEEECKDLQEVKYFTV